MDPDPEIILTVQDGINVGFCPSGQRRWFRLHPELDFRKFVKEGLPISAFPTDDAGIQRVIARKMENN